MKKLYYLYLAECCDNSIYCGITLDVERRIKEHNFGSKGAKYTRSRRPVKLLVSWPVCCVSCALTTEHHVKSLTKAKKLALIKSPETFKSICKTCQV